MPDDDVVADDPVVDASRAAVEDALDRLRETWGGVPTARKEWALTPAEWDRDRDRFAAGTVGGAGAWVRRDDGAALVVRHEGETAWSEPGGKQEPGESLAETAVRETREEAGIAVEIEGVLAAHRIRETAPDRPQLHRLIAVFEAAYAGGDPRPREGEIAAVRWVDDHLDDLLYPEIADFPL